MRSQTQVIVSVGKKRVHSVKNFQKWVYTRFNKRESGVMVQGLRPSRSDGDSLLRERKGVYFSVVDGAPFLSDLYPSMRGSPLGLSFTPGPQGGTTLRVPVSLGKTTSNPPPNYTAEL